MSNRKKLVWLITAATILRCTAAITTALGNDEVYYLSYAHHLQWNYFDHPPMVALLIRISTFNLHFTNAFFVRAGAIALAAVNTALVYRIAAKLKDSNAGLLAALLFTASPYCSVIAGTFILPDSPQLFFYILSVSLLADIAVSRAPTTELRIKLLLFGICSGLCIMSKVHGIFLWLGFGLHIITGRKELLREIYLYTAVILTAVIVSPILIWNIRNHFITYSFHSSRVTAGSQLHFDSFIRELGGGILYNNPVNYLLITTTIFLLLKNRRLLRTGIVQQLLWLSLPLIILLLGISLTRDTLPHWSGPAYISLIILTAVYLPVLLMRPQFLKKKILAFSYTGNILLATALTAGIIVVNFYPGTMGKKETALLGDGDVTLDMYGWKEAAEKFNALYKSNRQNKITVTSFIISNKWFPGAHIDNYIAQPLQLDFIALGDTNDIHTYAWLNAYREKLKAGDDAYFITASNNFQNPAEKYAGLFENYAVPDTIHIKRGGKPAKNILVYLLKNYRQK